MPVIDDTKVSLQADELENIPGLRCRGLMHKRVLAMLPEIMDDIVQHNLLQPALAYDIVSVKSLNKGVIELDQGTHLYAPLLSHRLARASGLAFGVATIGKGIATTIDRLFKTGKQFKAVLMEEIANACLYKLSLQIQHRVEEVVSKTNLQASSTLAPGDDGFDLGEQDRVLALAGASAINVRLSEAFMMEPRHSVSSVIGIGQHMQKWTQIETCSLCAGRDRCRHRHSVAALSP